MKITRLLRLPQIIGDKKKGIDGIFPISRSAWYAGIQEGKYPKPIKLGANTSAWLESDIQSLIDQMIAQSKNPSQSNAA